MRNEITYLFPNFNNCTVEIWELKNYLISHFIMDVITYPCCPYTWSVPVKGAQGAVSIRKTVLPGMAIPMLKIRRPNGRLIFNMEIAIRR